MEVELFHDMAAVCFDGIDAEGQGGGYLFVRLAFGDELEDLAFAAGEEIDGVGDVLAIVVEDGIGDGWTEIAFAPGDGTDGGYEVVFGGIL